MTDILERLRGYNPPDRTIDGDRQTAADIAEAASEIERLRLASGALHATACAILLVDGDRDHMNKSDMTCEMTQTIAAFLKSTARDMGYSEPAA